MKAKKKPFAEGLNGHAVSCDCDPCSIGRSPLPFEKQFRAGAVPFFHLTREGGRIPFHELSDQHLFLAWRVLFEKGYGTGAYMAAQREKVRRRLGVPPSPFKEYPMQIELMCGDCGAPMVLRSSRWGPFYGCTKFPECKGKMGAHPDGKPMGVPADAATRQKRIEAHHAFDALWIQNEFASAKVKKKRMSRTQAYAWMQKAMELEEGAAHIGNFSTEQCLRLISKVKTFLEAP